MRRNHRPHHTGKDHIHLVGVILLVLGLLLLAQYTMPDFNLTAYWPFILMALGLGLLWNHAKR